MTFFIGKYFIFSNFFAIFSGSRQQNRRFGKIKLWEKSLKVMAKSFKSKIVLSLVNQMQWSLPIQFWEPVINNFNWTIWETQLWTLKPWSFRSRRSPELITMSGMQATIEASVEFHHFYNVDLFQRGYEWTFLWFLTNTLICKTTIKHFKFKVLLEIFKMQLKRFFNHVFPGKA